MIAPQESLCPFPVHCFWIRVAMEGDKIQVRLPRCPSLTAQALSLRYAPSSIHDSNDFVRLQSVQTFGRKVRAPTLSQP